MLDMTVTMIQEITKSKYRIWIDGEVAFVLYKGDLRRYKIRCDESIDESVYREIMGQLLVKRARQRVLHLLVHRDMTVHQVRDKLVAGEYPEAVIGDAIAYAASFGYLGDEGYVQKYYETYREVKSIKRMQMDLISKGIDRDTIAHVFAAMQEAYADEEDAELLQIRKVLHKRGYSDDAECTYEERRKHFAFLLRKGFSASKIKVCLGKTTWDEGEEFT